MQMTSPVVSLIPYTEHHHLKRNLRGELDAPSERKEGRMETCPVDSNICVSNCVSNTIEVTKRDRFAKCKYICKYKP